MNTQAKKNALESAPFNRQGIIPIYYQIQEALMDGIKSGIFKPHDQLPSENELSARFGISRNTAQKALKGIVDKGAAYREQGRGTFVSDKQITYSITAKLSFSAELIGLRKETRSILNFKEVISATSYFAKVLEIQEGDKIFSIQRIRLVDDIPAAIMTSYIPRDLVPALLDKLVEESSLFQIIRVESGLEVASGHETLEVAHADKYSAELLGIQEGDAVFLLERVSKAYDGRVIELVKTMLRGDISKFHVELS